MISSVFSFRTLLYVAYAVVLTAMLMYVRFPEKKIKAYCETRIELLLPGSVGGIDQVNYRFPLSAAFESIKISRVIDGQESDTVVDRLTVSPEPLKFWRAFKVKGEMYSGSFETRLDLDRGAQTFQLENIQFEGIEAGEFAKGIGITDREISGIIGFSGDYRAKNSTPGDGTGKGVFQVVTGTMTLLQPLLALSTIEFERFAISVTQENGILSVVEGELLGNEIIADFTGELRMASPLLNSNILLSGHLEPDAGYLSSHPDQQQVVQRLLQRYKMTVLPFKLGGTVKRPLFRFST